MVVNNQSLLGAPTVDVTVKIFFIIYTAITRSKANGSNSPIASEQLLLFDYVLQYRYLLIIYKIIISRFMNYESTKKTYNHVYNYNQK